MTEKIISPKSTPQYPNLIYTPDLTLTTVNDMTDLQSFGEKNTPASYGVLELLEELIIVGRGYPVIFTATDTFDYSFSLNSNDEVAIQYFVQLYDNTASLTKFYDGQWAIDVVNISGALRTVWAFLPSMRIVWTLITDHEYAWKMSWMRQRTGTSTIAGTSFRRILIAQEIKR
jgi:hypothetical protein